MKDMFDFTFTLSQKEIVSFARRSVLTHPLTLGWSLMVPLGIAVLAVWGRDAERGGLAIAFFAVMGVVGLYVAYMVLIAPQSAYDRLPAAIREAPTSYRFSPTGIEIKTATAQARWDWSLFRSFGDAPNGIEIRPKSDGNPVFIPSRVLEAASRTEFRDFLRSKLPLS